MKLDRLLLGEIYFGFSRKKKRKNNLESAPEPLDMKFRCGEKALPASANIDATYENCIAWENAK